MKQGIQIIYTCGNHWIVALNLRGSNCEIQIFDSLHASFHKDTQKLILNLFETTGKVDLKMVEMSKQEGTQDCGIFAIAAATAITFGVNPVQLQ